MNNYFIQYLLGIAKVYHCPNVCHILKKTMCRMFDHRRVVLILHKTRLPTALYCVSFVIILNLIIGTEKDKEMSDIKLKSC